ncbi:MAG: thrombospondin type 3 repeat-containing protein [Gammaproteobacteria bacterium]
MLYSTSVVAPVAVITPPAGYRVGEAVTLDGGQSKAADHATLSYDWEIIRKPADSQVFIDAANTRSPSLVPDVPGIYGVSLEVNDGVRSSQREMLQWTTQAQAQAQAQVPVAVAGVPRTFSAGSTVRLDGAVSQAANKTELDYHWSLLYAPPSSNAQLGDSNAMSPRFIADAAGYYLVQLIVGNGSEVSEPVTVLHEVTSSGGLASMAKVTDSTRTLGQTGTDADGVMDLEDNCLLVANPLQRDTDGDGFGNFCDPDFNNDGVVNFLDFFLWQQNFLTDDPDADLDGSGSVNFLDGAIINTYYLLPPGPVGAVRWSSPVDGDWDNPLNWTPQIVPNENLVAIVDVEDDVTVSLIETVAVVKGLVMNESLLIEDGTLEALEAVELGGQISGTMTRINNTTFNPSMQGSGELVLEAGPHVWQGNTLNINAVIDTGATLFNSAGLTINETLTIDSHWFATAIEFTESQTVNSTGKLVLDGWGNPQNPAITLSPASLATVTFDSELLIQGGRAVIGSDTGSVRLLGDVISDIAGEELRIGGSTWFASGTIEAFGGGTLQLFGNLENDGASLSMESVNAPVQVSADANLTSASVAGSTGTVLSVQGGNSDWRDMSFDIDLLLENGAEVRVFDDIALNGTTTIQSTSLPTGLCFYSRQIISDAAAFVFDAASNPEPGEAYLCASSNLDAALTFGPQTSISGANGRLYTFSLNSEIVFDGQVNANVAETSIAINSGRFSGSGVFLATNGGVLELASNLDAGGSSIALDGADGRIVAEADIELKNAIVNATPGTVIEFTSGSDSEIANLVLNTDVLVSNSVLNVTGDLELNGTLTLGQLDPSDSILDFIGTQVLSGNATIIMEAAQFPGG